MNRQPHRQTGQRIRDARLNRKMTQEQVAQAIGNGCNRSVLSRAVLGESSLSSYTLARTAQALGVSADHLLGLPTHNHDRQDRPDLRERIALVDRDYLSGMLVHLELSGEQTDRCMELLREAWQNHCMTKRIDELILQAAEQVSNKPDTPR